MSVCPYSWELLQWGYFWKHALYTSIMPFLNSLFIPNNLLFLKLQVQCLWLQHTLRIFICISDFSHAIPLSTSIPCSSVSVNKPSWALRTCVSSSSAGSSHRMSQEPISSRWGSLHCHNNQQVESVVGRVPLWSSGLVTLPGHSPMYCTVT